MQNFRELVLRRKHTWLLLALVSAFTVRPLISDAGAGRVVFSGALLALLLVALVSVRGDDDPDNGGGVGIRRRNVAIWILAAVAVAERLYTIVAPSSDLVLAGTVTWLLFIGYVTWSVARSLFAQREVTGETIRMSMSIYLLLGLTWALLYAVLFQIQPDSFHFGQQAVVDLTESSADVLPLLFYFSLTVLSTVGFGDITPASPLAQQLAVTEAITGQFYIAVLVARLVAMQVSRPQASRHKEES